MEPQKAQRPAYNQRVAHYESPEGVQLLKELAAGRGVTVTMLLRMLVREEAKRQGIGGAE